MYLLYPLVGAVLAWAGLEYTGPPKSYGQWNLWSLALWLLFAGFSLRFFLALFGLAPEHDDISDEN